MLALNGLILLAVACFYNDFLALSYVLNSYQLESILKQLGNSPESSADFTSIKSSLAKNFGYSDIESAKVLPWETDLLKSEKILF